MNLRSSPNILFISDLHAPYQKPEALEFLAALHKRYKFSHIINIGDEIDGHAMSFHDSDPDLDSAGMELQKAREVLWELETMFPKMDLLESNHGSLAYRKAKHHGIPRHLILEYRDAIFGVKDKKGNVRRMGGMGDGWHWHHSLLVDIGGGRRVKAVHGMSASTKRNVEQAGVCYVQGHFHSSFEIVYHGTPEFLNFGMTIGSLIDDKSLAFAYNKSTMKRPVIGCGGIIDGQPRLFPMQLDRKGRWDKTTP